MFQDCQSPDGSDARRKLSEGLPRETAVLGSHSPTGVLPAEARPAGAQVPPPAGKHRETLQQRSARPRTHLERAFCHDGPRPPHQRHETEARARRQGPGDPVAPLRVAGKVTPTPLRFGHTLNAWRLRVN